MRDTIDEQGVVALLRRRLPTLLAVYLFGSHAQGMANDDSDIDIAVLVEGKLDPLQAWELAQTLAARAGCEVDLLDLRTSSTVMQYQVVTSGLRLWSKDGQAALYECFILSEKMELDMGRAGLLQDIQREGSIYGITA